MPNPFDPTPLPGPGATINSLAPVLELAARQRLGTLAQTAVNPDTGQIDYDKYVGAVLSDPLTAGFAGPQINQLRQAQVSQAQKAAIDQGLMGTGYKDLATVLYSTPNPYELASMLKARVASYPAYSQQLMMPVIGQLVQSMLAKPGGGMLDPSNPNDMALYNERRLEFANITAANATQRFGAFGAPGLVAQGWDTASSAFAPVPGPVTPGGAQTKEPAYMYGSGGQGGPVQTTLAPGTEQTITDLAKNYGDEGKKQYDNAVNMQGRLFTTQNDLDQVIARGPSFFTNPGTAAEARMQLGRAYNTFLQSMGAPEKYQIDPAKIGSIEELIKETKLNGFNFMNSMMGAQREAASIVQQAINSVPGANNSPLGMEYLINTWKELAQRMIDQRRFETNWIQDPKHDGSLIGAKEAFDKTYTPEAYAERAISNTRDPLTGQYPMAYKVTSKGDLGKYLPGTIVKYPDGRLQKISPQYSGIGLGPITLNAGNP